MQQIKPVNLTPNNPLQLTVGETLAYVSGELPFVVVHIAGQRVRLEYGACIPIHGEQVRIENPFSATARVNLGMNYPVSSVQPLPLTAPQNQRVTYNAAIRVANVTPEHTDRKKGMILMPKEGAFWVDLSFPMHGAFVLRLPFADLEYENDKPANMLDLDLGFTAFDGSTPDDLAAYFGSYTDLERAEWFAAADYSASQSRLVARYVQSFSGMIEAGSALMVYDPDQGDSFEMNGTVTDLGRLRGNGYV